MSLRSPSPYRLVRATLPVPPTLIEPGTTRSIYLHSHIPFRIVQFWVHSPGPDLLVTRLLCGNCSLLASWEPIAAETWDLDMVTRAVEAALAAGWGPRHPDDEHPLYARLRVQEMTLDIGYVLCVEVRNPTAEPVLFKATFVGTALESPSEQAPVGVNFHGPFDPSSAPRPFRFDDLGKMATVPKPEPLPEPLPETLPPPAEPDGEGSDCPTCGAAPGDRCHGLRAGKFHPTRGLGPGECVGCRALAASRAGGIRSVCVLCGKG